MKRGQPSLEALRGTLLAAWLACAHGLALVAGTLATAAPGFAHPAFANAIMCSGAGQPAKERSAPVLAHCTACPLVQPSGLPPALSVFAAPERIRIIAASLPVAAMPAPARRPGLPEARGPPPA